MNALFSHILIAIDLCPNAIKLINKTKELASYSDAKITVLHVIEPTPATEHIYVDQNEYHKIAIEEAKKELTSFEVFDYINENDCRFEFGSPKKIIIDIAKKLDCDLIVVGSHGRHGWKKILGSTAKAILDDAKTDVFVLRESNKD